MVTANAMNLQMTTQAMNGDTQQAAMSCHDEADTQSVKAHCVSCGFCVLATSFVSFGRFADLDIPEFKSFKTSFINDNFHSIADSPDHRPPILN